MKRLIFLLLILLPLLSFSQRTSIRSDNLKIKQKSRLIGDVTIGSSSFDASAILGITSVTKGLLIPRMNNTQRDAIGTPSTGLLIYSTTDNEFQFYETTWQAIGGIGAVADSSWIVSQHDTIKALNNTNIQVIDSTIFQEHLQTDKSFTVNFGLTTLKGIDATSGNFALDITDNVDTKLFRIRNDGKSAFNNATISDAAVEITDALKPLRIHRIANSNGDGLSLILALNNSSGAKQDYAVLSGFIVDNTAGSEDGKIAFTTLKSGTFSSTPDVTISEIGDLFVNNGNFGIFGSPNVPATDLDVRKSVSGGEVIIRVSNSNSAANSGAVFRVVSGSLGIAKLEFGDQAAFRAEIQADTDDNLIFSTTSSLTERMRIESGGNVGINETNPSEKLHVDGNILASGTINYFADTSIVNDSYGIIESSITTYTTGMNIYFMAGVANVGACTVQFNALAAKSLKILHDQDPPNDYIEVGSIVHCIYDGTNFQMLQPDANP